MKVELYISQLLFSYDCVIIPGFGGFVGNYAPAKIHPTQHTFTPPSKNLAFNKNLTNNDGLLAMLISSTENISFADSCLKISSFVSDLNNQLLLNKKVNLTKIGSFYYDVEKNLQFAPDKATNYLQEAFGLVEFQSPAIKRGTHHLPEKFVDRPPLPAAVRPNYLKKYWQAAVAVPVAALLIWIPAKTGILSNLDLNYSSINPFAASVASVYAPRTHTFVPVEVESIEEDVISAPVSYNYTPSEIAVSTPEEVIETTATPDPVIKSLESGNYYIIAGCFQSLENAQSLVDELNSKGLSSEIVDKSRSGLYRVSCGSGKSKEEALVALSKVKEDAASAWILKK